MSALGGRGASAGDAVTRATSWALATWTVPVAVVAWLVAALLVGLVVPDVGETTFFLVAAALAVAMAAAGSVLRRAAGPTVRGIGVGALYAGAACALVSVLVVVQ